MKILYVEDNEMNRDMLSRRLSRRGYEVLLAFDGQAGLDMMKSEKPDLVLMDMGLPVVDGWDATTQAKADPEVSTSAELTGCWLGFSTSPLQIFPDDHQNEIGQATRVCCHQVFRDLQNIG